MKRTTNMIAITAAAMWLGACSSSSEDNIDTTANGVARYQDAPAEGEPARPDAQTMLVEVRAEGTAEMSDLDPQCAVDGVTGSFDALFVGDAVIADDGSYVAAMSSGEAELTTPTGCEIADMEITAVTRVVVRATVEADSANCEVYCAANARYEGDASLAGECTAQCTTSAHVIVAETELSADAVAALAIDELSGAALGDIHADLVFDHTEE